MGWLVISIIIIVISMIIIGIETNSIVEGILKGLLVGIMISMLVIALFCIVAAFNQQEIGTYEEKQYEITGLENKTNTESNINGSFLLGFGYVSGSSSEKMKYYYFRTDENGKKLESIDGTDIYIKETNEESPCLVYKYQECVNKGFWKWLFGEEKNKYIDAKILVVPEDTIKIEYNVDI